MNDVTPTSAVLALPGFAAGIDWAATFFLLGIIVCVFVAIGAVGVLMLARHLPFIDLALTAQRPAQQPVQQPAQQPNPPPQQTYSAPDPQPGTDDGALSAQRSALIAGCVRVRGLVDDDMAVEILEDAMRRGGVRTFDATGAPLDPRRHRVDHAVPAPAPQSDGIVAHTLAPGYLDGQRVLRPADVVVYKWGRR